MSTKMLKWSLGLVLLALSLIALLRPSVDYLTILGALVIWAIAIIALKPRARASITSITDRTPGSESL